MIKQFTVMVWHATGLSVQKVDAPSAEQALQAGVHWLREARPRVYRSMTKSKVMEVLHGGTHS